MFKNVASQKLIVFAFDSTTNLPKTGDAANITAYVSKDYGAVTVLGDTSATEMSSSNAAGYYLFDLTQAETNANTLLFSAKSSTSNIVVLGAPATVFTRPPNFSALAIDSSGNLTGTTGDFTTAMTESYAADGATLTPAQALYMTWSLLAERNISGTTLTAKKVDGSTTSMTFTLNSAVSPTAQTRAT